jgi:hypothetical protein
MPDRFVRKTPASQGQNCGFQIEMLLTLDATQSNKAK